MSSYILTSKQKVIFILTLVGLLFILLNMAIAYLINIKTTADSYYNSKDGKIRFYNLKNNNYKMIVLGNSKALYHIDSKLFESNELNIFNYGISGAKLTDYPALIDSLKNSQSQFIAVSLSVDELINELVLPNYTTMEDLIFLFNYDKELFMDSLTKYFKNIIPFFSYSEEIYLKISSLFKKFEVKKKNGEKTGLESEMKKKIQNNYKPDCIYFDKWETKEGRVIYRCSNGDSIIVGNSNFNYSKKKDKVIDKNVVLYVSKLLDKIKSYSKIPVLIIEPSIKGYNLDTKSLSELKYVIVDMSNFRIYNKYIADDEHFNNQGRKMYSKKLIEKVERILK